MRINLIALVAFAAVLACLGHLSGVSGFSDSNVDHPDPVHGSHDVALASRRLQASGIPDRIRIATRVVFHIAKAVMGSIIASISQIRFRPRKQSTNEKELLAELSKGVKASRFFGLKSQLRSYKSKYRIDVLASGLQKAKNDKDLATSTRARDLLGDLLEYWWKKKMPIDDVAASLKIFKDPSLPGESDYMKIKVLRAFIARSHSEDKIYPVLFQTLQSIFGDLELAAILMRSAKYADAQKLMGLLMQKWKGYKLDADGAFMMLALKDKGTLVFNSAELLIVEQYAKALGHENALSVLTKGFGGEGNFAKLVYEALVSTKSPKAGDYLKALLRRWKAEGIKSDELLSTKFSEMHPTQDKEMMRSIEAVYRKYF
ncbi:unnamed protein product [Hyaloperonospora brassicae]|uniref:Secreted RxLR effector peptide protein n=1 Tax=Hyaloperonospora brassicae TaxID=162125 RepID=A0AAV0TFV1_HYABA|nr:unnamed protein product [Hyaloperonospora brassicae]